MERPGDPAPAPVRAGAAPATVFGRVVRAWGRPLVMVLPAQGVVPAALPPNEPEAAREALEPADEARLLAYDPDSRDACVGADEALVSQCSRLLAVWDGSASNGRDATAHLVAYARVRGAEVEVVWPVAAARGPIRHETSAIHPTHSIGHARSQETPR